MEVKKVDIAPEHTVISYTQFSMYQACPHSWELAYAKRLRTKEPNINLLFGTAMHNTIQSWLTVLYDSVQAGLNMNLSELLFTEMDTNFVSMCDSWGKSFSSAEELADYYNDGVSILSSIRKDYLSHYDTNDSKLYGIEAPIYVSPVEAIPNVKFLAYLDVVLSYLSNSMYLIQDIKTSKSGWGKYQKADKAKISQVLLYKHFFAQQNNIPLNTVTSQYFILKRKSATKTQVFIPGQTTASINKVVKSLNQFVVESFNSDGSYNFDREYPAICGYSNENCRFCEFKDKHDLCPVESRVPDIGLLS